MPRTLRAFVGVTMLAGVVLLAAPAHAGGFTQLVVRMLTKPRGVSAKTMPKGQSLLDAEGGATQLSTTFVDPKASYPKRFSEPGKWFTEPNATRRAFARTYGVDAGFGNRWNPIEEKRWSNKLVEVAATTHGEGSSGAVAGVAKKVAVVRSGWLGEGDYFAGASVVDWEASNATGRLQLTPNSQMPEVSVTYEAVFLPDSGISPGDLFLHSVVADPKGDSMAASRLFMFPGHSVTEVAQLLHGMRMDYPTSRVWTTLTDVTTPAEARKMRGYRHVGRKDYHSLGELANEGIAPLWRSYTEQEARRQAIVNSHPIATMLRESGGYRLERIVDVTHKRGDPTRVVAIFAPDEEVLDLLPIGMDRSMGSYFGQKFPRSDWTDEALSRAYQRERSRRR